MGLVRHIQHVLGLVCHNKHVLGLVRHNQHFVGLIHHNQHVLGLVRHNQHVLGFTPSQSTRSEFSPSQSTRSGFLFDILNFRYQVIYKIQLCFCSQLKNSNSKLFSQKICIFICIQHTSRNPLCNFSHKKDDIMLQADTIDLELFSSLQLLVFTYT